VTAPTADMGSWMRRIEQRLDALQRGNQISNGTITDPDTGKTVDLQSLAFGQEAAKDNGTWSNGGANQGTTFFFGGPDIFNVPVRSGRLIVVHSAQLEVLGNKATMTYSSLVRPAAGGADTAPSFSEALQVVDQNNSTFGVRVQASYYRVVTGLVPGLYNVYSAYNCQQFSTATTPQGSAQARALAVIPF
jgi:hypothetical protein